MGNGNVVDFFQLYSDEGVVRLRAEHHCTENLYLTDEGCCLYRTKLGDLDSHYGTNQVHDGHQKRLLYHTIGRLVR